MMNLNLKNELWKRRMTQRELAIRAGVSETLLSNVIRLGQGSEDVKDRICVTLGLPKERLFN